MAKTKTIEQRIKLIFGSHPEAKEFHFTSDGQAFRQQSDAANHARTLDDKAVTLITREMYKSGSLKLESQPAAAPEVALVSGAKNDFQAKGAKGSSSDMGDEAREELVRKYEMLSGKKAGNMKAETLTQKVAELESAAAQGGSGADADKGAGDGDDETKSDK